jgi:two-component system, chemotaxis family, CheB/CheR fusion protein
VGPGASLSLTIVALGASAGGLEALQGFFAGMPNDPRFAFVVITHLSPQHESRMAEVLRRATSMPVSEAQDAEPIAPGHVYVIPPNRLMGISDGRLRLEQAAPRPTIPHPIDYFMRALAEDQQERCAGIVLSGADHDGTAGLKEIKAAGGLAVVQEPGTAQFPGMPSSAIEAAVPDAVLPVEKMGQALVDYVEHAPEATALDPTPVTAAPDEDTSLPARLPQILALVRERSGRDFRWYRPAMLLRRLRRRMGLKSARDVDSYIALLKESDDELHALVKDFLINVTEFFRQCDAWKALEEQVLPGLVEERLAAGAGVRAWTPGCATGEESYSIAMLLLEQLGERNRAATVNVFASDVDTEALTVARAGSYPEAIIDEVGPQRLARHFERQGNRYVVRKALRESVVFSPQDLVRDPPFSKLDLIVCRNVLIYLEPAQQSRILEVFHFALNPNGVLFLGKSESLGQQADLFEPVSRTHRIFRRIGTATRLPRPFEGNWNGPGGFLTPATRSVSGEELDPAALVRAAFGGSSAAAILVNSDYRALHFHGETSLFLQPSGAVAWDLLSLLREGLRSRVRGALQQAITSVQPVEVDAYVKRDGGFKPVRIRVEQVSDFAKSGLLVVGFDDTQADAAPPGDEAIAGTALEAEVQRLRTELAAAESESEATTAELRVANEEAMSLNEEMQSSNEELQTSKEELQSMNEELASVNSELEDKVDELERALGDVRNFMDSSRVATIFLDRDLRIRRYTREAERLHRVLPSDEGRPLRDIVSNVADPGLLAAAADVLSDLQPREAEVATHEGDWFLRRILPYRARDERIEGVVITYVEITALRKAAEAARHFATVLHDSNDAVIVHDFTGRILFWNDGAEQAYGYTRQAALGMNVGQLEPAGAGGGALALAERVRTAASQGPVMARRLTHDGRLRNVSITVSALRDDAGVPYAVVTTERDITDNLRQESELRFRSMADDIPMLLRIEDPAGQAQFLNRAWLAYTGESAAEALLANGWFRYIHPDDLQGYVDGMGEARKKRMRYEGDMRLRRHDGSYRWIRTTAGTRRDDAGHPLGYVSVSVDIEERKRAEQAVTRESERKDEFLAMLAHELRNPLFPVANAVAVIERCNPADPKIIWASQVIARQTQQLARLVDDLMDVARITSGKGELTREPIEVAVLVERACEVSQPLIDGRSQHLTVTLPTDRSYVEGDLVRLTQVLGNLLNNASKYSDQGSEIGLTATSSATEVVFRVTDHGAGISAEMLPRVFDLFAQEDKTLDRAQGGLGIGLSLVDRLVRAHGGSVEAHSAGRGCGSEFIVRLPCLPLRQSSSAKQPVHAARQSDSRRILVVDDNVDGAESLAMLLEHEGHAVRSAKDGAEALAMAVAFHPDVVLLDIGLPGMSGYEVARNLRGSRGTSKALLIATTGYGQPEDVERAKAAGFDHHVVKPVSLEKLLGLVSEGAAQRPER